MADISAEIAAFKNAVYGEDVRDAMVSLANKLNTIVSSAENLSNDVTSNKQKVSNLYNWISSLSTDYTDKITETNIGYWTSTGTISPPTGGVTAEYTNFIDCDLDDEIFVWIEYSETKAAWGCIEFQTDTGVHRYRHSVSATTRYFLIYTKVTNSAYNKFSLAYRTFDENPTVKLFVNRKGDMDSYDIDTIIKTISLDNYDLKGYIPFVSGTLNNNNGADSTGYLWRLKIARRIKFPVDIYIEGNNTPYGFRVFQYPNQTESKTTDSGWIHNNVRVSIPANTYFRLVTVKDGWDNNPPDESIWPVNDNYYDHELYKNLRICSSNSYIDKKIDKLTEFNSKTDRKTFRSYAHQGITNVVGATYGGGRVKSYINAAKLGFTWAETDVVFTSDGYAVCCHDASFTDTNSGETVVIANSTLEQIKQHEYQHDVMATLDEVVSTCKTYGLCLDIDHISSFTDAQWQHMFDILTKYNMYDKCSWSGTLNSTAINKIRNYYDKAELVYTLGSGNINTAINWANTNFVQGAVLQLSLNHDNFSINDIVTCRESIPRGCIICAWNIDNADKYREYAPYVDGIYSNKFRLEDVFGY